METMILLCWMLTSNPVEICPPLPVGNGAELYDWRMGDVDSGIFVDIEGTRHGR